MLWEGRWAINCIKIHTRTDNWKWAVFLLSSRFIFPTVSLRRSLIRSCRGEEIFPTICRMYLPVTEKNTLVRWVCAHQCVSVCARRWEVSPYCFIASAMYSHVLIGISNLNGGLEIMKGDKEDQLEQLTQLPVQRQPFNKIRLLCVVCLPCHTKEYLFMNVFSY